MLPQNAPPCSCLLPLNNLQLLQIPPCQVSVSDWPSKTLFWFHDSQSGIDTWPPRNAPSGQISCNKLKKKVLPKWGSTIWLVSYMLIKTLNSFLTLHRDPNLEVLRLSLMAWFEPKTMCYLLGPHFLVFALTN